MDYYIGYIIFSPKSVSSVLTFVSYFARDCDCISNSDFYGLSALIYKAGCSSSRLEVTVVDVGGIVVCQAWKTNREKTGFSNKITIWRKGPSHLANAIQSKMFHINIKISNLNRLIKALIVLKVFSGVRTFFKNVFQLCPELKTLSGPVLTHMLVWVWLPII